MENNIFTPPSGPDQAVILSQAATAFINESNMASSSVVSNFEQSFKSIWNNPNGIAPQDMFNALFAMSITAVMLFQKANATGAFIIANINANYVPPSIPSQYSYTLNEDGSIIIITTPPQS